ncbi:MAG TPA: three-Cys-motif partner protein TcmP [Tepidisphaeraceae bacterium]
MMDDFFRAKRPWSQYKDLILGYYLEPYIPKVNKLGRPILIVDCFAGPGKFDDGKAGSPLIICAAIKRWREKGVNVRGVFIEDKRDHFEKLRHLLEQYADFATPKRGKFEEHLPELAELAAQNTVFLYIDPYTVKSLEFDPMRRVYLQIQHVGASVEALINFNAATFMRWGLAALKRLRGDIPEVATDEDDEPYGADDPLESVELSTLDAIAGGDYWHRIALDAALPFERKLHQLTEQYARLLETSFQSTVEPTRRKGWVGSYGVKSKYHHKVPKYYMVYATRSGHGIDLMNDAMCKARREFLKDEFASSEFLFDITPPAELADPTEVSEQLVILASRMKSPFTRRQLRLQALSQNFCRYSSKDYNNAVSSLLKEGKMYSRSGRTRINDDEPLSLTSFK